MSASKSVVKMLLAISAIVLAASSCLASQAPAQVVDVRNLTVNLGQDFTVTGNSVSPLSAGFTGQNMTIIRTSRPNDGNVTALLVSFYGDDLQSTNSTAVANQLGSQFLGRLIYSGAKELSTWSVTSSQG
jgi:hypothetical protein